MEYRLNNKDRSKIWELISKKKTKDGYFEIASIVNRIEEMFTDAYMSGVWDCIDETSVNEVSASEMLMSKFAPDHKIA